MGMYASSQFYESGFNVFKTTQGGPVANFIVVTSSQFADMATASTNALAWATGVASTDYVIASNTSGYDCTISGDVINATTLESTGVASHIHVGSSSQLYYVTTCTTKALGSGDTVTMPAWTIWIKQPTS